MNFMLNEIYKSQTTHRHIDRHTHTHTHTERQTEIQTDSMIFSDMVQLAKEMCPELHGE